MKTRYSVLVGIASLSILIFDASAALITQNIRATVISTTHEDTSIGTEYLFTSIYDDSLTRYNTFTNGADYIPGNSDDILSETTCLDTDSDLSSCNTQLSNYSYLSDAVTNVDSFYNSIFNQRGNNHFLTHNNFVTNTNNDLLTFGAQNFDLGFSFIFNNSHNGIGTIDTYGEYDDRFTTQFSLQISNSEQSDVPEPNMIALMGLGLFGLGLCRRQRNKVINSSF